jgi:hypothetical protein
MKKTIIFAMMMLAVLSGCKKQAPVPDMDVLGSDNKFHYQNQDLGFGLLLPAEFQKYQTQRTKSDQFNDVEFFVPTADTEFPYEVPGYATAIVVRVFSDKQWSSYDKKTFINDTFKSLGSGNGEVYFIKFWKVRPTDWQGIWTNQKETDTIGSFDIIK